MRRTRLLLSLLAALIVFGSGSLISIVLRSDDSAGTAEPVAASAPPAGGVASPSGGAPAASGGAPSAPGDAPAVPGGAVPDWAARTQALDAALAEYAKDAPDFAAAVLDRGTGQVYSYRGTEQFETAGAVRVTVLACLLLRAQDEERAPDAEEKRLARLMIRSGSDEATTGVLASLGEADGLTPCAGKLGLTGTVAGEPWGLTRTTADDQVRLLSHLVDPDGPLDTASREYAFGLMNEVEKAGAWGVPAAAREGETTTVGNGADDREADDGRWAVNSIGRIVSGQGTDVSVAVLSRDNLTRKKGVALVEKVAELTRQHLRY